jgi:pimeloyl-ACP methyl ester carboxylesterase
MTDPATLASQRLPGEGPLLVYLHGLGCAGSRDWPPVAASPALRGRASLWVDLLGFGQSPRPRDFDYTLGSQARLVAELLEAHPGPLALVGHSLGGTLAVLLAERLIAAGRVPSAVLLAEPNLRPEDASLSAKTAKQPEAAFVGGWERFLEKLGTGWYAQSVRLADPRAFHRSAVSLVAEGGQMLARFLALPIARKGHVVGAHSDATALETARLVALGGVPVVRVAQSGHNFSSDHPAGLAAALVELLGP